MSASSALINTRETLEAVYTNTTHYHNVII